MGLFTQNGLLRTTFFTNDGLLRLLYDPTLVVDLDLRTNTLPDGLTFSRPSIKTDEINGQLIQFASGSPAISAANGYFSEGQATNLAINGDATGYVVGTYLSTGSLPTGWGFSGGSTAGLSVDIVGGGVESGVSYVDLRFYGTSTASVFSIILSPNTTVTSGSVLSSSCFCKAIVDSTTLVSYFSQTAIIGGSGAANGTSEKNTIGTLASRRLVQNGATAGTGATAARPILGVNVANGVAVDFTIRVGGAQLEVGPKATSYIPTTTAAATRAADVLYKNMTGIANISEGTLFAQINDASGNPGAVKYLAALSDGGILTNAVESYIINTSEVPVGRVFSASAEQANISSSVYSGGRFKHAIGYKLNDVNIAANGVLGTKDTSSASPATLNRLDIGNRNDGFRGLGGYVEAVRYYNKRKTDAELQAMTA